ncbi:aspartate/glutamate racemase family protein [Gorillibacterium massiliense]|uniref:aspartate/glutamate racemase family protein n=1 Tax=Gorillibacterium massiliense TaxID=1280390 RepID=UPI0004B97C0F|nr:amino acid racemase [Gorillibacterium massiliense]
MEQKMVGIIGGMGPYASSAFVNTVYERNLISCKEQEGPRLVLYSDPSLPDRTSTLQSGESSALVAKLESICRQLEKIDVDYLIMACVTAHSFLDELPPSLMPRVINLISIIQSEVQLSSKRYLLLATEGSYRNKSLTGPNIIHPSEHHQHEIHQIAYSLKTAGEQHPMINHMFSRIQELVLLYKADGWISGCTEFHLLSRYAYSRKDKRRFHIVDPLMVLANNWKQLENYTKGGGVLHERVQFCGA